MLRTSFTVAAVILLPVAVALMGCSKSAPPAGAGKPSAAVGQNSANPADVVQEGQSESAQQGEHDAEIAAVLAKLSAEDRALVEKQKICLVSGEPLGSMGAPRNWMSKANRFSSAARDAGRSCWPVRTNTLRSSTSSARRRTRVLADTFQGSRARLAG